LPLWLLGFSSEVYWHNAWKTTSLIEAGRLKSALVALKTIHIAYYHATIDALDVEPNAKK